MSRNREHFEYLHIYLIESTCRDSVAEGINVFNDNFFQEFDMVCIKNRIFIANVKKSK